MDRSREDVNFYGITNAQLRGSTSIHSPSFGGRIQGPTNEKRAARTRSTSHVQVKKKRINIRNIFAVLMFFLGLAIILYPGVAQYVNSLSETRLIERYFAADSDSVSNGGGLVDDTGGALGKGAGVLSEGIFGSISIPKLKLELPIYTGVTSANLSRGIAHLEGTSLPVGGESTHSVLCGHNGAVTNEWFTHIDQLGEGDIFYIRTKEYYLTYKVISAKVIYPDDTSDLYIKEGEDLVTLLTCTRSGTMRLIVTGERLLDPAWNNG